MTRPKIKQEEILPPSAVDLYDITDEKGEPITQIKVYCIAREVDSNDKDLEKIVKNLTIQFQADLEIKIFNTNEL